MMTQLTITGPYINQTLFEQAGVAVPADDADWDDWAEAARQVAEATGTTFPMALDRSGHRLAGPAIRMGAKFFDAEGKPAVVDDGFSAMVEKFVDWHEDGTMAKDVWAGQGGAAYQDAAQEFINANLVYYFSGSWQVGALRGGDRRRVRLAGGGACPAAPAAAPACRAAPASSASRRPSIPRRSPR